MTDSMQVENYRNLDLSPNGEVVKNLLNGVASETEDTQIRLTDHIGELPANLTPFMASWYRTNISGLRGQALDAVATVLGTNNDQKGTRGVFLERSISVEQDRRIEQKRQAEKSSREKRAADYDRYDSAKVEHGKAKEDYNELRARHGREAHPTPMWYYPALMIIGVFEALINFESFSAIKAFTPAIALGVTLIVAVALAYASHLHGTVIRQLESRFGAHRKDGDRASSFWMLGIGFLLLSAVLSLVWYARNSLLAEQILENSVIGGEAPSALFMIGGSMIGNVIVWLLGVAIAFFAHDEDHNYPGALKHKQASEKKMYALHERINNPLKREFEKIDATCEKEISQARNKHASMSSDKDFASGRALLARVGEQDSKVIAALELYRMQLTSALRGKRTEFEVQSELDSAEDEKLNPTQYAARPLILKHI
ncbi:hypothetical protein [Agrobacterium larrymoorei]|uniref:Uncharacterized protein n=1 Tax=Agrobacterium larrymoorei TaxID=160699 RepID=A0AAF0KG51_9HYPH|nr:hypothetical protein [Agrobacterium larrymoorei]WHA43993.1 hypothetical protein CFBP5477_023015 [Agrobacterium larrymoorei]